MATTGCPVGDARPVVEGRTVVHLGRMAVRPGGASKFALFRAALRLPVVFATFFLYNAHVPGPNENPIHFHSSPFF